MKKVKIEGFTLVEILIALFIFTLVSLLMTSALHNILRQEAHTEEASDHFNTLQTAFLLLSRDISQIIYRPFDTDKKIFTGTPNAFTCIHAGFSNPLGQLARPTIQRTAYEFSNQHLTRMSWPLPDATSHSKPSQRLLLDNIEEVTFSYLDSSGKFHQNWSRETQDNTAPRAIKIIVTLKNQEKIQQFYRIPVRASVLSPSL